MLPFAHSSVEHSPSFLFLSFFFFSFLFIRILLKSETFVSPSIVRFLGYLVYFQLFVRDFLWTSIRNCLLKNFDNKEENGRFSTLKYYEPNDFLGVYFFSNNLLLAFITNLCIKQLNISSYIKIKINTKSLCLSKDGCLLNFTLLFLIKRGTRKIL